jgi:hypothetical protein
VERPSEVSPDLGAARVSHTMSETAGRAAAPRLAAVFAHAGEVSETGVLPKTSSNATGGQSAIQK